MKGSVLKEPGTCPGLDGELSVGDLGIHEVCGVWKGLCWELWSVLMDFTCKDDGPTKKRKQMVFRVSVSSLLCVDVMGKKPRVAAPRSSDMYHQHACIHVSILGDETIRTISTIPHRAKLSHEAMSPPLNG